MEPGVSTVVGALVGGSASLAGSMLTQRWQRQRDGQRRKEEAQAQALVAARILLGDLSWARARIKQALRNQKYWSQRYELMSASWDEYRETLALCLPSAADWWVVHNAFRAIHTLQLHATKSRGPHEQSQAPLTRFGTEQAEQKLSRIREAIALLEPIAGTSIAEEALGEESVIERP